MLVAWMPGAPTIAPALADGDVVGPVPAALPGAPALPSEVRAKLIKALAARGADYVPRTSNLHADGRPKYTNRLLLEPSPYLRQHAHNPVNWFPWGDEAFAEARRLGRPILVSIGYSTCHWCHVMEEETFDVESSAEYLNAHFIAIKVDRESRPDIDTIYMSALHAMGQRGGWPLNVFVTPDAKPFYGGTYFPPEDRAGRPGFMTILRRIQRELDENPEAIEQNADRLVARLETSLAGASADASHEIDSAPLDLARERYETRADKTWGGIGSRTKFPSSLPIRFLLREHRRTQESASLALASVTLERMAAGGIHDHLGGGFHRYSTDPRWLIPHFEIMLYDNALLALAYTEASQLTGRDDFEQIARGILDYVLREMTSPEGAFYSATDADSLDTTGEAHEGWFFTWTPVEIEAALGVDRAPAFIAYYGVTPKGNVEGRSILHSWRSDVTVAEEIGISTSELHLTLNAARAELRKTRALRAPPLRDDKIIVAWNGLMISALARSGFALDEPRYVDAARRAADFIQNRMHSEGRLQRIYLDGEASGPAFLDDHTFLIAGLLDLFEADANPRWLANALALERVLDAHYLDVQRGGYFRTPNDEAVVIVREKRVSDGAIPSGSSVQAANLLRLAAFTGDDAYLEKMRQLFAGVIDQIQKDPTSLSELLLTLSDQLAGTREVVIVAPAEGGDLEAMLRPLRERFVPNRVLAVTREGKEMAAMVDLVPLVESKRALSGRVTAYVCENRVCSYPTSDPKILAQQLSVIGPLAPSEELHGP